MEKLVKGATKIKLAAPKSKYVEPILSATHGGETGVAEIFRTLQLRLRDSTWTIVFKSLLIVHLMIREGAPEVTLRYLAGSEQRLAISSFTEVQTQGSNIKRYYEYLLERVKGYQDTKTDFVRTGASRIRSLTVDKGLLRQTEIVQRQIKALLKCDMLGGSDPDNEISMTAFRLLTMDLLELYKVMNEGTIHVLEHYFEMSKTDAQRALEIYKTFARQTDAVVQYLSMARQVQGHTRLEVPKLKHAPTTLTSSLEEYLNDPDFEINRRQYLAQQEAKRTGKPLSRPPPKADLPEQRSTNTTTTPAVKPAPVQPPKGPAPDLIDFFESIEQNQQPIAQYSSNFAQAQTYPQPQIVPQPTAYNPFLQNLSTPTAQQPQAQVQPIQADFTGAGFGGYGPQPIPTQTQTYGFSSTTNMFPQHDVVGLTQQSQMPAAGLSTPQSLQIQPTGTNPFRQSMLMNGLGTLNSDTDGTNRQSTNPFARFNGNAQPLQQSTQQQAMAPIIENQIHQSASPQMSLQNFSPSTAPAIQPQRTGTNPFAKTISPPPTANVLPVHVTGSTNPFRQSQFVNQQTGQGWQHSNQGTIGGVSLNNLPTTSIFPRPGVQQS